VTSQKTSIDGSEPPGPARPRTRLAVSLATTALQLALAVALGGVAIDNLRRLIRAAPLIGEARFLEAEGATSNPFVAAALLERMPSPGDVAALAADCQPEILRAAMTVRLLELETARGAAPEEFRRRREDALAIVNRRLRCAPSDGAAWLNRARLVADGGGAAAEVDALLRLSYHFAPAEGWVLRPRFAFQAPRVEAGQTALNAEFARDVERLRGNAEPEDIAEFYVGSGPRVRAILAREIDKLPAGQQRRAAEEIDRLGVPFKRAL
jgi:hypothetical protein